jgi:hypothetical protein
MLYLYNERSEIPFLWVWKLNVGVLYLDMLSVQEMRRCG